MLLLIRAFFFFYRALAADAPVVPHPVGLLYLPYAFEVSTCTARCPHIYNDARDL
jgi:hypothetical protein